MAFDKFLIAPISDGLRRDVKPWLIPDQAFEELNNAYIFRGRIKKRAGAVNTGVITDLASEGSRLRANVGTTDGAGNIAGTVPGGAAGIGAIGQMFSIGSEFFTVYQANGNMYTTSPTATVFTYNTATGVYNIQGSLAATDLYFYPAKPVMGFTQYEQSEINDEDTYAWDTFFNYKLLSTGWERVDGATVPGDAQWAGSNSEFFWSTNWRGTDDYSYILFTTNYNSAERLRYFDGTNWTSWRPQYASNANETIETCRIIIPFQNRLLLLNTVERNAAGNPFTYVNRCRYSRIGSPIAANSYREDIGGEGSFIDAPTREAIVSAATLRNRLIVFFERSTYELVYLGNQVYPFRWQKLNSTLGCESTFSVIPFDKVVLGVGQTGIHACNGANVERIDSKIPDEVFEIHNDDDGVFRVHGIRDYYNEMAYWAMPHSEQYQSYPNRVLIYNYKNDTWAFWDDNITAFGYHQLFTDTTWATIPHEWENYDQQWNDGTMESKFRYVIAGNQQGYTFLIHRDFSFNAFSQQITDIQEAAGVVTITSIDHNLKVGDWVYINNVSGIVALNDNIYKVGSAPTSDTFTIDLPPTVTGTYTGGGVLLLVSKVDIYSKRFNFYSPKGLSTNIEKADFLVDKIDNSEITIDYLSGTSQLSLRDAGIDTGSILGSAVLEFGAYPTVTYQATQERFWHAVYLQATGESIQLRMYWSDDQMEDSAISFNPFDIHAILFHTSPSQDL